jgi:hypothetical protein
MINLAFLVRIGISGAFVRKFPYLINHLKDQKGRINADTPFRIDNKAEEWLIQNITVNKEVLN